VSVSIRQDEVDSDAEVMFRQQLVPVGPLQRRRLVVDEPGVDVIMYHFRNFCTFRRKKMAIFSKRDSCIYNYNTGFVQSRLDIF
jgi:hypothetical protein